MALKVYLDDGCKAERSRVISLLRRKRKGWSQSKSLGNSPLWDFIEFLQTGWWWAWRCSMHQVTHEFCELEDGVCPTASTDCQNKGDSTSHQKQCGILLCTRKKKKQHKRWEFWICWDTDVLQTWFLPFPSTPKFWQNQPSCFKCFDFCQQNPFQQNMVLSKHPQEDFVLSLVSVAQLWKWDRKKELAANLQLPGNCQDANPSTLKPLEWHYSLNDPVKIY